MDTKPTIYFAHCAADYDSDREARALQALQLNGYSVLNPNEKRWQDGYDAAGGRGMQYWCDLAMTCDVFAYMVTADGKLGSGVAKELLEAICAGKPVFEVLVYGPPSEAITLTAELDLDKMLCHYHIMTIEETRAACRAAKQQTAPDNAGAAAGPPSAT